MLVVKTLKELLLCISGMGINNVKLRLIWINIKNLRYWLDFLYDAKGGERIAYPSFNQF